MSSIRQKFHAGLKIWILLSRAENNRFQLNVRSKNARNDYSTNQLAPPTLVNFNCFWNKKNGLVELVFTHSGRELKYNVID